MSDTVLLAIDQGTSSTRCIAFSPDGALLGNEQQEFAQIYPQPGWVEHDPELLWNTSLSTARQVLSHHGSKVAAIGLANQRETVVLWDRETGQALHNAIVWQDRRTAELCRKLAADGFEPELAEKTGLRLDPYFSATKLAWMLEAIPGARDAARAGKLACGTVDSFLIWRLTGGRSHVTDATNASRTALYDIRKNQWDPALCEAFGVPMALLPEVRDSASDFGTTDMVSFGYKLPIRGVAGDQQAALVGHACFAPGEAKSTYGTGAFLVVNSGGTLLRSKNNLLSTIAYRINGETTYALEGSILSAGATIQWLRDGLGLFVKASETEALARSVADSGGVYLVPAFAGLGAPYWDPEARGALVGLTRGSGRGEIVRAGIDSTAFQTRDLLDAMAADGIEPRLLKVDGGMTANLLLMERLADILGVPVLRPKVAETTAFGAACLAGLGCGLYSSLDEISGFWQADQRCDPNIDEATRAQEIEGWRRAVSRVTTL